MLIHKSIITALVAASASTVALPLLVTPAGAETKHSIAKKENALAAAGFVVKPASTPARVAMLLRLPKDKFARRIKGDVVTYVYADPKVCNCLYVGSQQAYGRYQHAVQQQKLTDQLQMAAEDYSDPAWNWRAWGGWGPHWGFGRYGW